MTNANLFFVKLISLFGQWFTANSGSASPETVPLPVCSIDTLADKKCADLGVFIEKTCATEKLKFKGGYLHIIYNHEDSQNIQLNAELYFITEAGGYKKLEPTSKISIKTLDQQSQDTIKSKLDMKFQIGEL